MKWHSCVVCTGFYFQFRIMNQSPSLILGMPTIDFGAIQMPGAGGAGPSRAPAAQGNPDDPATIRQMLLASPHDIALLKERNPPLAEALLSGSLGEFISASHSEIHGNSQMGIY